MIDRELLNYPEQFVMRLNEMIGRIASLEKELADLKRKTQSTP